MTRRWFRRRPSDDEMREEIEAHVALRAEHDRRAVKARPTDEDAYVARRRFGNMLQTREAVRRVWVARWWDELWQDAWFTWRSWRRKPGFALGAILVLALGLGASTALFAALDRVLFRPLPYADPDRLVSAGLLIPLPGESLSSATETIFDKAYVQVWDTPPAPFESVTATSGTRDCDIGEAQPERVRCGAVDHNFLQVLGVPVAHGRDFRPEDDLRGAPPVALISHALWVRRYGADPSAVGRILSLESTNAPIQRVPIIGVLPPHFEMPVGTADILLPMRIRPLDPQQQFMRFLTAFARLEPDVTPARAEQLLEAQLPLMREFMPPSARATWKVQPLHDRRVGDASRIGWLLIGAVAIFLLIACVNVTNLMLTRVAERQREFAVRAAVGAGSLRLARLALTESAFLALMAGSVGFLIAFALLKTFVLMAPAGIPGIAEASLDLRVFVLAALLVLVTGIAVGLWPAISVFRAGNWGLRSTGTSAPGTRPRARFALVTTQTALTLALLGGSALLLRSLWNVVNVPLGFDAERVITVSTGLSATRYPTPVHRSAFFEELLSRARATPGAVAATLSSAPPPLGATLAHQSIEVEGRPDSPGRRHDVILIREVTPEYFATFRVRVISGRAFEGADRDVGGVVLSESAERILFPGERAEGRRVRFERSGPWHTVVGVASDVRNGQRIFDAPTAEAYVVARRDEWSANAHLALRTGAPLAEAAVVLRQIVADIDPLLPATIQTVEERVARLTARPRFIAVLLSAFAALALLLGATGLYSVASYLVTQRRRDIGVRIAVGASPRDVARQVVGEAGRWIVGGTLAGIALGWMGTRALQSQLYQVDALDPLSWTGALLALMVVLVIAVSRPAFAAAHVDPVTALRGD